MYGNQMRCLSFSENFMVQGYKNERLVMSRSYLFKKNKKFSKRHLNYFFVRVMNSIT